MWYTGKRRERPTFKKAAGGFCDDMEDRKRKDEGFSDAQPYLQPQGSRMCISLAVANMIFFMEGGGKLKSIGYMKNGGYRPLDVDWHRTLNWTLKKVFPKKIWRKRKDSEVRNFHIVETDRSSKIPLLITLEKDCGISDHCIGIIGDTIYDSCNDYTLKRTMENIHHACRPSKFGKIVSIFEMIDNEKDIQAVQDKIKRKRRRSKHSELEQEEINKKKRNSKRKQRKKATSQSQNGP